MKRKARGPVVTGALPTGVSLASGVSASPLSVSTFCFALFFFWYVGVEVWKWVGNCGVSLVSGVPASLFSVGSVFLTFFVCMCVCVYAHPEARLLIRLSSLRCECSILRCCVCTPVFLSFRKWESVNVRHESRIWGCRPRAAAARRHRLRLFPTGAAAGGRWRFGHWVGYVCVFVHIDILI